jgi:hypothetical protein
MEGMKEVDMRLFLVTSQEAARRVDAQCAP